MKSETVIEEMNKCFYALKAFHEEIIDQNKQKLVDFDNPQMQQEVMSRIKQLRNKFVEETKSFSSSVKPN